MEPWERKIAGHVSIESSTMMERYPVVSSGKVLGYVRTFPDFIEVTREDRVSYFVWCGGYGSRLRSEDVELVRPWREPGMGAHGYLVENVSEYLSLLSSRLKEHLSGKRVLVDFSGGKDSVATLALLSMLSRELDIELYAGYVHIPLLEPPENLEFASRAARRLDAEFVYVEADRRLLRFYLENLGLPKKGRRWCTYLKIRGLRELKKSVKADFEAKGDRLLEAGKRMKRLSHFLRKGAFVDGRKVNVVYPLTILDVVRLVRDLGLIHPQYLEGIPRVSCKYCPYKSLYELEASSRLEVEDEGYVEYVARREHRRLYSPLVDWETFWGHHLWRFSPTPAALIARLKVRACGSEDLTLEEARRMFSSMWREPLPETATLGFEDLAELVRSATVESETSASARSL